MVAASFEAAVLLISRQGGGTAFAKLKRGAAAAASAAVLNAIASIVGELPAPSTDVGRGGEKVKDGCVGGDRELVRVSGMRIELPAMCSVLSHAVFATEKGDTCTDPAPCVGCQAACCAAVALVR